jgi:catechol 2,3-dioxygenase-like lactoylglutathione lyase family enzyme
MWVTRLTKRVGTIGSFYAIEILTENNMPVQLLIDTPEFGIVTTNIEAMQHFYQDIVGLQYLEKLEFSGGYMHRYQFGSAILKLVVCEATPEITPIQDTPMGATGYRYATLVVSNLREFVQEVIDAGFKASEITDFGGGIGYAFVVDPDGNYLELAGTV